MRAVVRTALGVAALAAIVQVASWLADARMVVNPQGPPSPVSSSTVDARCPPGTLPDGRACIPVPDNEAPADASAITPNAADQLIPRRPDRPEPYARYQWPVAPSAEGVLPGESPGTVLIAQQRGAPVYSRKLVHQVGDAEVLAVTDLVGTTVIAVYTLRHANQLKQYVVLYGRLQQVTPGLKPGTNLAPNAVLGKVGDSGRPGDVHLYLEVRQVRRNVDVKRLPVSELRHPARTVACDPRNVFPVK